MIGIDTNVLLRHVTLDDPEQSAQAGAFMDALTPENPGFISLITLVETVWTLRKRYGVDIDTIGGLVTTLLGSRELVVQEADMVRRVARESVSSSADFADLVIAYVGISFGCDYTVTFDKKAAKIPGMILLGAR